jgi:hypothetical protein
MSVPSRIISMFSKKPSSSNETKSPLTEPICQGLIYLCIELCHRKQAARVLEEIKSKECEKLRQLIENGNLKSKYLSEIAETNIIWTCLIQQLDLCLPLITKPMTSEILQDDSVEAITVAISALPSHHKKLIGALIPTAEALGEENHRLAEQILREVGSRIIEPSGSPGSGQANDRSSIETAFVRLASHNKYLFPYTRQFYLDAGTLEIPDSATFWDLIADHRDEGVLALSHQPPGSTLTRSFSAKSGAIPPGTLERTLSAPLNRSGNFEREASVASSATQGREEKDGSRSPHTLFDRNRREMNQRLSTVDDDDDEKETERRDIQRFSDDDHDDDGDIISPPRRQTRGRRGLNTPHSPPPHVPLPSGPKPTQPQGTKKPIFLVSDSETNRGKGGPQLTATTDDLREIFEKCSVPGGRIVELRSRPPSPLPPSSLTPP